MRVRVPLLLLAALAGCDRYGAPVPVPEPWADDTPLALEPLREVLRVTLADASTPSRLVSLPDVPSLAVLDAGTGTAHVLDARYRHAGSRFCLDLSDWEHLDDGTDRQGDCAGGEAEIRPGELDPPGGARVVVADPAGQRVWIVSGTGALLAATLDLLGDHPLDYLRPALVADTAIGAGSGVGVGAVATDGTVWVLLDDALHHLAADGALLSTEALPAGATDLAVIGDAAWVTTAAGLWVDGTTVDVGGAPARLVADGDTAWISVPARDVLVRDGEEVAVEGLTGPLARDPRSGRLYAAVEDGVAVVADSAEIARVSTGAPVDVAANASGEVSVLLAGGEVVVLVDDVTLAGPAPLAVAVAGFFENPRKSEQAVPCVGDGETFAAYLATAAANRAWLDDVPAAVMLGITPQVARTAVECSAESDLRAVWDAARTEPGALFHEQPDCGGDQACLEDDLLAELETLADAGIDPGWSSGAPTWDLDGEDWVAAIGAVAPPKVLFFGLSLLPSIPQEDPRGKDPYPWHGEAPPTAWRPRDASAPETHAADGPIALYPGNNVPAFLLGGCPNLTVRACDRLGQGGGATFDADDVAVLDLLLHRALAHRSEAGPDTWSFHLPAIEKYDYTEGCSVLERTWSGEACEAALLQGWLLDVNRRYVLGGLATWTLPAELPSP